MGIPVILISLIVGVMSDHADRRMLLLVSQTGALLITVAVAAMVSFGHITIRYAVIGSFISGIFIAIGSPVRNAIIPSIVPSDKLVGAIAVNTIGSNLGLISGPVAAGPAIAVWGIEGAFWLQAAMHLVGFFALIPLQLPASVNTQRKRMREEIFGGVDRHFAIQPQNSAKRLVVHWRTVLGWVCADRAWSIQFDRHDVRAAICLGARWWFLYEPESNSHSKQHTSSRDGSSDGRPFSIDVRFGAARRTLRWPNRTPNRFGTRDFFSSRCFDAAYCNLFLDYKEEFALNGLVFRP